MLRKPLLVQQEIDGKIVKTKLLRKSKRPFVIGSSRRADMRVDEANVNGIHTALEYRHPHWYVINMDPSATETELRLDENREVNIANQKIKLLLGEAPKTIYENQSRTEISDCNAHQVVVFAGNNVVSTHYLPPTQPYALNLGTETRVLEAPKSNEWSETKLGRFSVKQRLTYKPQQIANPKVRFDLLKTQENRNSAIVAAVFSVLLLLAIIIKPEPKTEVKKDENEFVQMIFDQKTVQKMQQEAKAITQDRFSPPPANKIDTTPVPKQQLAQKVVKDIKKTGITDLVAKISKRASVSAMQFEAVGKTADNLNTGSALSKIGSSKVAGKVDAASSGHSIGGVKTAGKVGGNGNYAQGTALGGSGVGSGTVGILEEETIVEGGLDKEVIAEFIKSKLGQIRYCYERQLSGNPNLHGTVLIKFTIGGNGNVVNQSVARSTLKDANVEECILRRVAGWNFPLPKGGTSVVVSYPFLFKSIN